MVWVFCGFPLYIFYVKSVHFIVSLLHRPITAIVVMWHYCIPYRGTLLVTYFLFAYLFLLPLLYSLLHLSFVYFLPVLFRISSILLLSFWCLFVPFLLPDCSVIPFSFWFFFVPLLYRFPFLYCIVLFRIAASFVWFSGSFIVSFVLSALLLLPLRALFVTSTMAQPASRPRVARALAPSLRAAYFVCAPGRCFLRNRGISTVRVVVCFSQVTSKKLSVSSLLLLLPNAGAHCHLPILYILSLPSTAPWCCQVVVMFLFLPLLVYHQSLSSTCQGSSANRVELRWTGLNFAEQSWTSPNRVEGGGAAWSNCATAEQPRSVCNSLPLRCFSMLLQSASRVNPVGCCQSRSNRVAVCSRTMFTKVAISQVLGVPLKPYMPAAYVGHLSTTAFTHTR